MKKPRSIGSHFSVCVGLTVAGVLGFGSRGFAASLVGNSPFLPSGQSGSAANAPAQAYELAGSSRQGAAVIVCIFEHQTKHAQWIGVGETVDGIRVVSYDPATDSAWVTINGEKKELSMRKTGSTLASSAVSDAAPKYNLAIPPTAPTEPASQSPAALAQDQREARMLVSDLLEIGVQQRKAYQDAKRKASSETSAQPAN